MTVGKLEVERWQFEHFIDLMMGRRIRDADKDQKAFWDILWAWSKAHMEIVPPPVKVPDLPTKYVFFGYKQDATHYRLEHDIDPKDMILARDFDKLEGLRARIIRVGQDSEWSRLNWHHSISYKARDMCNHIEAMVGG
jgi:hypothetical protein